MKNIFTLFIFLIVFKISAQPCLPAAGKTDLDINNVRARIMNGGDMWWDLQFSAHYEIPKGSNKHSAFAGAIWFGAIDNLGLLRVAAMSYRQTGNDFWPGPLDTIDGNTNAFVCNEYDRLWKLRKTDVEAFVNNGNDATEAILNWPAHGDVSKGQAKYLAPFVDINGNGKYEPHLGDYPAFDLDNTQGCNAKLKGDMAIWWVFNDKGNLHRESGGEPLGLEIHATAYAYRTNDALNDATFYNYKIINRGNNQLNQMYFGKWMDPALGRYDDDYVGSDVGRGLAYCYNGFEIDAGPQGYGANPPAIGIDYFEGPLMDANGLDDTDDACLNRFTINGFGFNDGIVDNERYGITQFMYYENDFSVRGYPENADQFYKLITGRWKDGTPLVYNGTNGYGTGIPTHYMYPGDSDPFGIAHGCQPLPPWTEFTAGNSPWNRRFMTSAGPFTMQPGAVQDISLGVIWARASSGGNMASVEKLKKVDDDIQWLFDHCFKVMKGPETPKAEIVELDKELVLILSPNQQIFDYKDSTVFAGNGIHHYAFQGYKIYQLKDETVSTKDFKNIDKARLVAQCDIKDDVSQLINYYYNPQIEEMVPEEEVMGANEGIKHSFSIKTNAFAQGDIRLVNHQTYYYAVVAYASAVEPYFRMPISYIESKHTIESEILEIYRGIPHINAPNLNGLNLQSFYDDGPLLERIEGQGNGGMILDFTAETVEKILLPPYWLQHPVYKARRGPIDIKVINPKNIPNGNFELYLNGIQNSSAWTIQNEALQITSASSLVNPYEEILLPMGFSIIAKQVEQPGIENGFEQHNGFLESSIEFSDITKRWLTFLKDEEGGNNYANWIRSGVDTSVSGFWDYLGIDNEQVYEKVFNGAFAPVRLVSREIHGPWYGGAGATAQSLASLQKLQSVDIVLTADKSKWSRCPVFETCDFPIQTVGNAGKLDLRRSPSVNKEGQIDNSGTLGMGWFPGYAVCLETGERLNIAFGEASNLAENNGRDMLFNPTASIRFPAAPVPSNAPEMLWLMGGKHFIYVFGHHAALPNNMPRYDEGQYIYNQLSDPTNNNYTAMKRNVFKDAMWTAIPLLEPGFGLLSSDVKIRLRVQKPYRSGYNATETADNAINNNFPLYHFSSNSIFTERNNQNTAVEALNLINVVPNPYYAYSAYEQSTDDRRVKVTNLPDQCLVQIYTVQGQLVRTFQKNTSQITFLDWDLKNEKGVLVGSGMYLVRIYADGVGERIIKMMCMMRPNANDSVKKKK